MKESQNIEYKESWKDDYLKWICGFANAQGGVIYIGIDDDGNISPLKDAKKILEDIPNKVRDILGILVDVNLYEDKGLEYIEIKVEAYPYPVNYKGQYYYRSGSTKQELKGPALDKFLLERKGKRWDSVPVPNVGVDDLKEEAFDHFKKTSIRSGRMEEEVLLDTNLHLLDNLHLIEGGYLKRAALLLFHPKPEIFVTGAYIKIGFFESDSDLKYQDEIHGDIFEQIEKTMGILYSKYIKSIISYEGIHRVETAEYPKEAVREALLNAIVHKDYSGNTPIQISVYRDKLMIWNEGQLPEDWTVEKLSEKHSSKPYNPDIANVIFRSGYIESWGRGTIKIIEQCVANGLPIPVYRYDTSGLWVIFNKDIYVTEYLESFKLMTRQLDALLFWKAKGEITTGEYSMKYQVSDRTALRDLTDLVERGLLLKTGDKKSTKYLFKNQNVG